MNAVNQHVITEQTIHAWCMDMSSSIKQRNLEQHMALISERVQVYGMPSKDSINYKEWKNRRRNEFSNNEVLALNYEGVHIISSTTRRIRFETTEKLLGQDGKMVFLNKQILLECEDDQAWRVVEENVQSWRVKKLDLQSF